MGWANTVKVIKATKLNKLKADFSGGRLPMK
jgi:hypothetical protein